METRHPIEGSFAIEFPVICNHCRVMAAWSRKTLKFCVKFLRFLKEKRGFLVPLPRYNVILCQKSQDFPNPCIIKHVNLSSCLTDPHQIGESIG